MILHGGIQFQCYRGDRLQEREKEKHAGDASTVCEVQARAHSNYIQVHSSIFNYLQQRQIDSHGKTAALAGPK